MTKESKYQKQELLVGSEMPPSFYARLLPGNACRAPQAARSIQPDNAQPISSLVWPSLEAIKISMA